MTSIKLNTDMHFLCRYGWVNSTELVILRHKANDICGGNQTGIIKKNKDGNKYDAFCYDAKGLCKVVHTWCMF